MLRNTVYNAITKAVPDDTAFAILHPAEETHGDYATNAAFLLAKKDKKAPRSIAKELAEKIPSDAFEKIEATPNGFINFFVKKEVLYDELAAILEKKETYGEGAAKKEKIHVEFISANPTGPITLGNGRGAFLGNTLTKILRTAGYDAHSEYYVNDAKASKQIQDLGKSIHGEESSYPYLDELYFNKNPELKEQLKKMSAEEAGHSLALYIQKENEEVIKKLGISFNTFVHEESFFEEGAIEEAKKVLAKKNLSYQKDGALWCKTSAHGDSEDRVLVRSTGEPTYFLSDITYHLDKIVRRKFDTIIDIWGADHHGAQARMNAALSALGISKEKVHIIITQLVRLIKDGKEVKMSKRVGQFETLEDFVKDVGPDAARFFFLEKSADTHIDFDMDLAREQSVKNPIYYIQYAFTRCGSILQKVKSQKSKVKSFKLLKEKEELALIKKLAEFPEIIEDTAKDYQVHRLTRYTLDLARKFHNFYEKHRVISDDAELTQARLALIEGVRIIIGNALDLLGISKPEKM